MSVPGLLKNFVAAQKDPSSFSSFEAYEDFSNSEFITASEELEVLKASPKNQV